MTLQELSPISKKKWTSDDIPDQTGKIFLITGANSGLGYEATYQLARHNGTVIMACRNLEKGQSAFDTVKSEFPNANIHLMQLDLASFDSIKTFVREFANKFDKLDVLLNNAGIMQPPRRETEQGIELQFGVNHIGHFLLTDLLWNLLKTTPGSRIINQSSIAHKTGRINFDDINSEKKYSRTGAYGQSKLSNLLFTYELHRKLQDSNLDILAIGVHPGYTNTELQQNGPQVGGKSFLSRLYRFTDWLMAQDVSMGTLPMLYAATMDDVHSGDYIGPKGMGGSRGYPRRVKSNKASYNKEDAEKLWKISEDLIGEEFKVE